MSSTIEVKVNFDPPDRSYGEIRGEVTDEFERQFLYLTLAKYEGNLTAAARALKMDRKYLRELARKHGLR